MPKPEGPLTYWQMEVMEVIWDLGEASTPEVWEHLADTRGVARTTVLTQVQRLEARGWLKRKLRSAPVVFKPTIARAVALGRATDEFLETYFEGSAAALVQNLLGAGKLDKAEVTRLRALVNAKGKKS